MGAKLPDLYATRLVAGSGLAATTRASHSMNEGTGSDLFSGKASGLDHRMRSADTDTTDNSWEGAQPLRDIVWHLVLIQPR